MKSNKALRVLLGLVILGILGLAFLFIVDAGEVVDSKTVAATPERIEHGRYLAVAGDCVACHTKPGGEEFAGGAPLETPFGKIYAPNITPDKETGIGDWTVTDIRRALHLGKGHKAENLYPAFSYPYYTKVTFHDAEDIALYLKSLAPVKAQTPANEMKFPFNIRFLVKGWNLLHFRAGTFEADPKQSAQWNRGAYLVEGLGHCGACHTPKNLMFGDKMKQALQGGVVENWYASDLTNNEKSGLGKWSEDEIVEFLKTGMNAHSIAYGTMTDVVQHSTSKMTDGDLHAIATYLKSVKGTAAAASPAPDAAVMAAGKASYAKACADCHVDDGSGIPALYSPLAGNANLSATDPSSVVHIILTGHENPFGGEGMPGFASKLTDKELAALSTYIRNSFGNNAPAVTDKQVAKIRKAVVKPAPAAAPAEPAAPAAEAAPAPEAK